jgi:hypothetical protein
MGWFFLAILGEATEVTIMKNVVGHPYSTGLLFVQQSVWPLLMFLCIEIKIYPIKNRSTLLKKCSWFIWGARFFFTGGRADGHLLPGTITQ